MHKQIVTEILQSLKGEDLAGFSTKLDALRKAISQWGPTDDYDTYWLDVFAVAFPIFV
ncbi:MAG: hypothetical protein ACOCXP_03630 [Candidatus Dojkabacteria bacterium]